MKWVKRVFKLLAAVLLLLVILLASLITTQDDTPLVDTSFYKQWKEIAADPAIRPVITADSLKAGWADVNITPGKPGPMAGYGKRRGKPFVGVHDSVFVRTLVLESSMTRAAIVSADLLIIPPTVTARLRQLLTPSDIPYEHIYLGATHTHNSVGGWGTGISGLFFSGSYDPEVEEYLAQAIVRSLRKAQRHVESATLTYREAYDTANINNRLIGDEGTVDPEIRAFELQAKSGRKLTLVTFGAHSTVLNSGTMLLSRDWPGILLDSLHNGKQESGMYLAGAVGSMAPRSQGDTDLEAMADQGNGVYQALKGVVADTAVTRPGLAALTLPLPLGDPNPRLTTRWALRSWAFNRLFGEYPNEIKALRLGNILMIGLPCDFSGELMAPLDSYAKARGLNLIVTSFNGGYIGYVTADRWYDLDQYETVTMNWFGPYKGAYFQEAIKDLIDLFK
ncbi:MAG: hypothetical protein ABS46_17925 [Cytophagaceae bacterium SCN 52-12]|nr:MAG: hypothetical protein ABS46_17925 [Cytophagaceae bacterium SCN 52-12]